MLMAHTMQIEDMSQVRRVFDLKGSTVDRRVKMTRSTSRQKTLKDENLLCLQSRTRNGLVEMFQSDRAFVLAQLKRDTQFLRDLNIMDYSLLLCIEKRRAKAGSSDVEPCRQGCGKPVTFSGPVSPLQLNSSSGTSGNINQLLTGGSHSSTPTSTVVGQGALVNLSDNFSDGHPSLGSAARHQFLPKQVSAAQKRIMSYNNALRHQLESEDGEYVYHIALIDYLQEWNFDKKMELFLKRTFKGRQADRISCVEPTAYCARFNNFVRDHVITEGAFNSQGFYRQPGSKGYGSNGSAENRV